MSQALRDHRVRLAAFEWLREQTAVHGDVLPRTLLAEGFVFEEQRVPLVSPQGIFKPKVLPELPLTITTTQHGPYDDSFGRDGLLAYRYRGRDPNHRDNVALRKAMERGTPLIYFHAIVQGKYLAVWPVYVVGDSPDTLTFKIAVDDVDVALESKPDEWEKIQVAESTQIRRAYITSTVRRRLHQRSFREWVLRAYREQCALCRLRHEELLDAAHIIEDPDPAGEPIVQNGLALCKLHHAAFDRYFLGISPDYVVEVRQDILDEIDGPTLVYGLQGMHRTRIALPKRVELWPDRERLGLRYERFRGVG